MPRGRPRKKVDLELVSELAKIQCTDEEIAACCHVSTETLRRRKREDTKLAEAIAAGRQAGRMSLRRLMRQQAEKGDIRMILMLGKNLLGYTDKPEGLSPADADGVEQSPEEMSDDELLRIAASGRD